MLNVRDGLDFKANKDGSIIIIRNGGIIASLTKNEWITVIAHMAKKNRPIDEILYFAERLHIGDRYLHTGGTIGN